MKNYKRQKTPRRKHKHKKITYREYSEMCRFRFNIQDYPQEFDLDLINQIGWCNKDNPNGLSRDHMLSISYGWKRDIPAIIISHPANCEIMRYENNHEKGWRSSFNLHELIMRIKDWNKKYK